VRGRDLPQGRHDAAGARRDRGRALPEPPALADPVRAFHAVSHDLTCSRPLRLEDGTTATPLELQWHYLEAVKRYVKERATGGPEVDRDVLDAGRRC
jgi:Pup amidohydrolase